MEASGRNSYYYPHPLIARHFVSALGLDLVICAAMLNILFNNLECSKICLHENSVSELLYCHQAEKGYV